MADRDPADPDPAHSGPADREPRRQGSSGAAAQRIHQQALWVDLQITEAMDRGDFDDLPGAGKPIEGLGARHDPDWWVKQLVERERITGVLPPALMLRTEDAELHDLLDRETAEPEVRRLLEDFNRRVVAARRQLEGGPPVITPTRDVEAEVARWRERRQARRSRPAPPVEPRRPRRPRRRWPFSRRRSSGENS